MPAGLTPKAEQSPERNVAAVVQAASNNDGSGGSVSQPVRWAPLGSKLQQPLHAAGRIEPSLNGTFVIAGPAR